LEGYASFVGRSMAVSGGILGLAGGGECNEGGGVHIRMVDSTQVVVLAAAVPPASTLDPARL
jgi:hypothetical protein